MSLYKRLHVCKTSQFRRCNWNCSNEVSQNFPKRHCLIQKTENIFFYDESTWKKHWEKTLPEQIYYNKKDKEKSWIHVTLCSIDLDIGPDSPIRLRGSKCLKNRSWIERRLMPLNSWLQEIYCSAILKDFSF